MWALLFAAMAAVYAAGLVYISFRSARWRFSLRMVRSRRWAARLLWLVLYLLLTALLALTLNLFNALVCMLHLYLFWLFCELAALLAAKCRKKKPERNWAGPAALLLCAVYLSCGWISDHAVRQTRYAFSSPKLWEPLRIVQISDCHVGATFDALGLAEYVAEINALNPDLVVVTGDFVDDNSTRENMLGGCKALGELRSRYGVFFVWGNHDRGYYSAKRRGWSAAELRNCLEGNGVVLLEDEARLIGGSFFLVGRRDRSERRRLSAAELLAGLGRERYVILLDHQPSDFDAEAAAGADLVLCGHTHGGQLIPITHVGEWSGAVDLRYGHEKRGETDFIVSSGISNWTLRFKTGCFSEYVIVDLNPSRAEP